MASNIKLVSGSPLIGNPIVYSVTAASISGEVSFHKVKLEVTASLLLATDDQPVNKEQKIVLTFSSPVSSGETVNIDISSALRAAADNYVFHFTPPSAYPHIKYSLKAWDEYMQNGLEAQKTGVVTNDGGTAIFGAFSDLERLYATNSKQVYHFSRKPGGADGSQCEVAVEGDTLVIPEDYDENKNVGNITAGPSVKLYVASLADDEKAEGAIKQYGFDAYFVISKDVAKRMGGAYQFRIINSLGVMETYSVFGRATHQANISSEKYTIALSELFSSFSRGIYEKKNDYEKLKLSSGVLNSYWAAWFVHEFLMAKMAWIKIDDKWIPCHIVPEDTVTMVDYTKSDAITIDFTVEMDINGSTRQFMSI